MFIMKQTPSCSRSKPPPARSSCSNPTRLRGQPNSENNITAPLVESQYSFAVSVTSESASGNTTSGMGEHGFPPVGLLAASPKDVSDCLSGWLTYLQMLNGLCGAGSRLSHSLSALAVDPTSPCHGLATQCQTAWEELVKATAVASSAVKTQVLTALQEVSTTNGTDSDTDSQRRWQENNQQVLCSILMTFVNLHYQFCATCCDYLGSISANCCTSAGQQHDVECIVGKLQQCFTRLHTPAQGPHRGSARSPAHLTLSSLQGTQRRWSEAAASLEPPEAGDGQMRRWSMPWDTSRAINSSGKLAVPTAQDRSRSNTPESTWHSTLASQDELQDVIQLLSCRPAFAQSTQLYNPGPSQHLPGVTLTACPYDGPQTDCGGWGDNGGLESGAPSRRGSNSPSSHRGSWQAPDMYMLDADVLASRKSSSSTDSSSSYSLHARSSTGSEGSAEIRAHLYSMWSGSDLSFNKVPESSEPPELPSPSNAAPQQQRYQLPSPSNTQQQRFPQADSNQTFYSDAK